MALFNEGDWLGEHYRVVGFLGNGLQGEVYRVKEHDTKIERAAKVFYPDQNIKNKELLSYAHKLHSLRHCSIVIGYHHHEAFSWEENRYNVLFSDLAEGESLESFVNKQKGKRIGVFQALHLLYALAKGMEEVHALGEYHGDLHEGNVVIQRSGLHFDLKVLDTFQWGEGKKANIKADVVDMINTFYFCLGGAKTYPKQGRLVRDICCGLKKTLILKKFSTAGRLRNYLEQVEWHGALD